MSKDKMSDDNKRHLSFTIHNSPYSVAMKISPGFTLGDLKKLILEKYSLQQKSNHLPLVFSTRKMDMDTLKISVLQLEDDSLDFCKHFQEHFIHIDVENPNILTRINDMPDVKQVETEEPKLHNLGFASFSFYESNVTAQKAYEQKIHYPTRQTSQQIPFVYIGTFTADKSILVRFLTRKQLNWGEGPTDPQRFFRLYIDGKVGVYYEGGIQDDFIYTKYKSKFQSIEQFLLADVYKICVPYRETTWNNQVDPCDICYDAPPIIMFVPCLHIRSCDKCAKTSKCTQCNQLINLKVPVQHASSFIK